MAQHNERPVLIAGGGIGGLAAALGLAQKGIASILLEKASALGEIGAGIQLGPNAFHAFDYLGVGEAARNMAVYIDQQRLMDALTAEEITHVDLGDAFRARFGNPYAVVHRGDQHGVFLKACQDHPLIELRVSSEVLGFDQDGSSVTAKLASGERGKLRRAFLALLRDVNVDVADAGGGDSWQKFSRKRIHKRQ